MPLNPYAAGAGLEQPGTFGESEQRPASTTIRSLIERAATEADVPIAVILGETRCRPVAKARQRAMADAWFAGFTTPQIGRHFHRDHTTVLHAIKLRREGKL